MVKCWFRRKGLMNGWETKLLIPGCRTIGARDFTGGERRLSGGIVWKLYAVQGGLSVTLFNSKRGLLGRAFYSAMLTESNIRFPDRVEKKAESGVIE